MQRLTSYSRRIPWKRMLFTDYSSEHLQRKINTKTPFQSPTTKHWKNNKNNGQSRKFLTWSLMFSGHWTIWMLCISPKWIVKSFESLLFNITPPTTTTKNKIKRRGQDYKAKLKTIATLALVLAMSELKAWRANFWLKVSLRHTAWWHRVACALRKCEKFNLLDDSPRYLFAIEQNLNECRPVLHFSAPLFLRSE